MLNKSKSFNSSNKKAGSQDSFLEAFRDLGAGTISTIKEDLVKKGAKDIVNSLLPFTQPSTESEIDPSLNNADLERKYQNKLRRAENIRREEKILFTRQEKITNNQVKSLQEEILKLAKATGELGKQVEIAASQQVVETGTYHVGFFEHLRKLIIELRSQIQESSYWLAAWNKKSQKKNYYWSQFKKSGSKFLLSSDRYMATQAG